MLQHGNNVMSCQNKTQVLAKEGYPELRCMLVMGGIDPKLQYDTLKNVSSTV